MDTNTWNERPLRVCDLCGGVDRDPRHVITGLARLPKPGQDILQRVLANAPTAEQARLISELLDTDASDRHMDCCRAAGCPDGICDTQTAGAEELRGGDLLAHLTEGAGQ